jgi:hypothetical protein
MKKSVLALALAFGVTTAFAQDLTSKKGEPILPEAGDWSIGIDANPFLLYAGNFFGKSASNTAPTFDFLSGNNTILGKYFTDEKTAIRVGINLGFANHSATNLVLQDQQAVVAGAAPTMVTDKASVSQSAIGLTGGIEMRKGKTRLQGYYGGEVGIWFGSTHQKNTYGNAYATGTAAGTSPTPNSTSWSTSAGVPFATGSAAAVSRTTDDKSGATFAFGVRGFVGVEYFVLPKMSLGGEFGWGIGMQHKGAGQTTNEAIYSGSSPSTQVTKTGTTNAFVIGTDNRNSFFGPTSSLRLNFYF